MTSGTRSAWIGGFLLVLLPLVAAGCGGRGGGKGPDPQEALLREVWLLYNGGPKAMRRSPPAKLTDLRDQAKMHPHGYTALQQGDIVLAWGADLSKIADPQNTILAYGRDVPQSGGLVLMADGSIKHMTPEAFQAAPKAKK